MSESNVELLKHRIKTFENILKEDGIHMSKVYNAEMDMLDAFIRVFEEHDIWRTDE